MTPKAEATAILDRWQTQLPAGVDPTDLHTLRKALTDPHRHQETAPALTLNRTSLRLNPAFMHQLGTIRRMRLVIEDGTPVIHPDIDGWAVVKNSNGCGGMIVAPALCNLMRQAFQPGTRWVMEYDLPTNRWRGKPI